MGILDVKISVDFRGREHLINVSAPHYLRPLSDFLLGYQMMFFFTPVF